jgi:AcrR family transcriptional regulator
VDRFTLTQVAARLDVTPPALYRVVTSRDELLGLCFSRIMRAMRVPEATLGWQDQLRAFAQAIWDLCEQFPGMPLALVGNPSVHERVSSAMVEFVGRVAGTDLSPDTALFALDFIADTVCMTHIGIVPMRERGADGMTGLERSQANYHSAAAEGGFSGDLFEQDPAWLERGFLDRKIDFIIAGLEAGLT